MALKYEIVPVTPFEQNCSLVWCDVTMSAAVVDPGGDLPKIQARIDALGLKLDKIILTHAHIDHAGAVGELSTSQNLPIEGPHKEDQFWIDMLPQQSQMFGFAPAQSFTPNRWLEQGDTVEIGQEILEV
ncbi:MBL fold metallo-hydrolase, partial [Oleiphilus sp. HI0066]|uniref:MBL fold metallo-hydrolase n=3 Tax=Oleiphilus TaxID=141450 RepID=UPI000A93364E